MLSQDELNDHLRSQMQDDWAQAIRNRASKLPETDLKIVDILSQPIAGGEDFLSRYLAYQQAGQQLRKYALSFYHLSSSRRHACFEALLPQLADTMAVAWDRYIPQYPSFYELESPRDIHELLAQGRMAWLLKICCALVPYNPDILWVAKWAHGLFEMDNTHSLARLMAASIDTDPVHGPEVMALLMANASGELEHGTMGRHAPSGLMGCSNLDAWAFVEQLLLSAQRQEGLRLTILQAAGMGHPQAFSRMLKLILDHDLLRFNSVVHSADSWFNLNYQSTNAAPIKKLIELAHRFLEDPAAITSALEGQDAQAAYIAIWASRLVDPFASYEQVIRLLTHVEPHMRFTAVHALQLMNTQDASLAMIQCLDDPDLQVAHLSLDGLPYLGQNYFNQLQLASKSGQQSGDKDLSQAITINLTNGLFAPEARFDLDDTDETGHAESDQESQAALNSRVEKVAVQNDAFRADIFNKLIAIIDRMPSKPRAFKPMLWPWYSPLLARSDAADSLAFFAGLDRWDRIAPYLSTMTPPYREQIIELLKLHKTLNPGMRRIVLQLTGDLSSSVRNAAIKLLSKHQPTSQEIEHCENLLTRKAGDLRRGIIYLLAKQTDDAALDSAKRLVASKNKQQRIAGLDLLRILYTKDRQKQTSEDLIKQYVADHIPLAEDEKLLLEPVLGKQYKQDKQDKQDKQAKPKAVPTLDDALGLVDTGKLTRPTPVKNHQTPLLTPALMAYLQSLNDLVQQYREVVLRYQDYTGKQEQPLGTTAYLHDWQAIEVVDEDKLNMPLAKVWQTWWKNRPSDLRDDDGLDLVRAEVACTFYDYSGRINQEIDLPEILLASNKTHLFYHKQVAGILRYLVSQSRPANTLDFLLDAAETALALIPPQTASKVLRSDGHYHTAWLAFVKLKYKQNPEYFSDQQLARLINLMLWLHHPVDANRQDIISDKKKVDQDLQNQSEPSRLIYYLNNANNIIRRNIEVSLLGHALRLGCLNEHDAAARMVVNRQRLVKDEHYLRLLTSRRPHPAIKDHPPLASIVDKVRQHLLEVELTRGEQATVSSHLITHIQSVPGVDWLVRHLQALGKQSLSRERLYAWRENTGRTAVFSHLVRVSYPQKSDTPEAFAQAVKEASIGSVRLVELAMYAPQWAMHVEHALGWEGLADGVWWIHAHTKDGQWQPASDELTAWLGEIAERTPLSSDELFAGAVDVNWFNKISKKLAKKQWEQLYKAAKNASTNTGHVRAKLFASAMRGDVTKTELKERVVKKRQQDSVRAIGLLPLASGKARQADLLSRYEMLQEFLRTSKQFGAQRRASEKRAVEIGQDNLARTAGYPDPIRLQWAMETLAASDLAQGSISVTSGQTTVSLTINDAGEPEISVIKEGKPLKAIPAAVKKEKQIKALQERKILLTRQASRMRASLEQMMCSGEQFVGEELASLCNHPLMKPILERIVLIGENIIGYPAKQGRVLADHTGKLRPIRKDELLTIAHPHHMLKRNDWSAWQRDCFNVKRVQPFKQLFRELYPITQAELDNDQSSSRYEGHQVHPAQALALLGKRGWVAHYEEGLRKTFHAAKISVHLEFLEGYFTPAEVDGLTIQGVHFTKSNTWDTLPPKAIPPLIFSEVMRDLDLVVSVAHRGGVDPQSSASTVQMRADLLRETLTALNITNVRIENNFAFIDGKHANYTLHLGSAQCHVLPGGSLCIIPVHSQHRGRLFLPFVDDDPKTAEVVSKVLLLARDQQIRDPDILEQIRSRIS